MNIDLTVVIPPTKKVIDAIGNNAVFKGDSNDGVYDIDTGQYTVTDNNIPIKMIPEYYSSKEVGGEILTGDVKLLCIIDDIVPNTSNKIVFDGLTFNIVNVRPMKYQDVLFYYELHCRV